MRVEVEEDSLEVGVRRVIFNASLRKIRREKGISQKELCEATGLAMSRIVPIERLVRIPTHDEADKIADALGVTIDEILPSKIYEKIVPKISEIPSEVFFEVTPMSLSFNEVKQLESTEGDIEQINEEIDMQMIVNRYVD
jgi:transcriptional regulator with XRE-family HTH domain